MTIMTALHWLACSFLAGGGRAGQLYFFPYAKCQWCKNRRSGAAQPRARRLLGRVLAAWRRRRMSRPCWRCHDCRRVRRWGARYIHRGRLAAGDAWNERRHGL